MKPIARFHFLNGFVQANAELKKLTTDEFGMFLCSSMSSIEQQLLLEMSTSKEAHTMKNEVIKIMITPFILDNKK